MKVILILLTLISISAYADGINKSEPKKLLSQDCEPYKSFWEYRETDPNFEIPKKCIEEFTAIDAITPKKKSRVGEHVRL